MLSVVDWMSTEKRASSDRCIAGEMPTFRSRSSFNAWFVDLVSIQAHRSLEARTGTNRRYLRFPNARDPGASATFSEDISESHGHLAGFSSVLNS
jgi:hypothetical protein